jgi:hypothetical protein
MRNRGTLSLRARRALERLEPDAVRHPEKNVDRQKGGYERAARHAVRLARFPGILLDLVNRGWWEPPGSGLSPQETVTQLAKYVPELEEDLRRWRVRRARSLSPLTLVPFLKARFEVAPLLAQLARPPHRMTTNTIALSVLSQRELENRWASVAFAIHFFTRLEDVEAWRDNCFEAAAWFERLRSVPESTALLRRCRTPQCPTPLFLYRGGRPPRICPRCRHAISRSFRRRTVTD